MATITVTYHDGDSCVTLINGTPSQIIEFFLGSVRTFEEFDKDGNVFSQKKICTQVNIHADETRGSDDHDTVHVLTDKQSRLAAFHSGDKGLALFYLCLEKTVEPNYWERITKNMDGFQTAEVLKSVLLKTWNYVLEADDFKV